MNHASLLENNEDCGAGNWSEKFVSMIVFGLTSSVRIQDVPSVQQNWASWCSHCFNHNNAFVINLVYRLKTPGGAAAESWS